jgi:hypothetical protein
MWIENLESVIDEILLQIQVNIYYLMHELLQYNLTI